MIGIAKVIGRILAVLIANGIIDEEQAIWIIEPLKDESEENKCQI